MHSNMAYPVRQLTGTEVPALLGEIPDAPTTLSIRGELPDQTLKYLAVVGSRSMTDYGKAACEELIEGLAGLPIVVVSGLAFGVDSTAHKAALHSGLTTIAVPGSGLDDSVLYPGAHRALANQILNAGGALLSEFPPLQEAAPWTFPKRNRIMAGLTHATLVVEAGLPSGSLITARLALEYNREVLAVPGPIFSKHSAGTNDLLRRGAALVASAADIAAALGLSIADDRKASYEHLSPDEQLIVSLLETPQTRDELIDELPLPTAAVNILLTTLELKNIIIEREGRIYLV